MSCAPALMFFGSYSADLSLGHHAASIDDNKYKDERRESFNFNSP